MKKNLAEMHLFNVVDIMRRLSRELRRLCAGSADRAAEILDVIVISGGRFEPAVAWAKALCSSESEGPYGEAEHYANDGLIEWKDRYAQCRVRRPDENHYVVWFYTTGGHGLELTIDLPHYDEKTDKQVDGDIEVVADGLVSERFWADDDGDYLAEDGNASPQVVTNRESAFLKALAVDDNEFADREAEARVAHKADFERRLSERPPRPPRARPAKVAIEAAKAATEAKASAEA